MSIIARQSTARIVTVGPVLDADGVAVTTAAVGDFKISKNGGAPAALNGSATLTHRHTGHYSLSLTASDLDTVGSAEILLDKTTDVCPPKVITVIEEAVYDALFAASADGKLPATLAAADVSGNLPANATQWGGTAVASANVLIDGAITAAKLASDAIQAAKIQDGAFTAAKFAAGALNDKGNWNVGKTGYSLSQAFPANFGDLAITETTGRVTVGTNADKTAYTLHADYDAAKTAAQAGDAMDLVNAPNATAVAAIQAGLSTFDHTSDVVAADVVAVLGTVLTESGAGWVSGAVSHFFDVETPEKTVNDVGGGGGEGGEQDWTSTERQQIRHRLGIDGSASEPSATPSLSTLSAAGVRTAVGLASANLDDQLLGVRPYLTGTAQGGSTTTITLAADAPSLSNLLNGWWIVLTGGDSPHVARRIRTYDGSTKVATVAGGFFNPVPDSSTTYAIFRDADVNVGVWRDDVPGALVFASVPSAVLAMGTNAITAAAIASNAINSAKIANNAITAAKINDGALTAAKFASGAFDAVWSVSTRTLTSLGSLLDSVTAALASLLGYAARVDGLIEDDGAENDRFTAKALEQAVTEDVYNAEVRLNRDNTNGQDEYTVRWFKNGVRVTSGIASPTIQVVKRADGADLIGESSMTQIGSTGGYKYDESDGRVTPGEDAEVIVRATIDGETRADSWIVGRDSEAE